MNLLARAEIIARLAHRGQTDKGNVDYTEHLKAVAGMVEGYHEKMAAWLHDTLEDTPLAHHDLEQLGFPKVVVEAVILLSHDTARVSHADYIREIRDAAGPAGDLARAVKRADLKHNSDPNRGSGVPSEKLEKRYTKAIRILYRIDP